MHQGKRLIKKYPNRRLYDVAISSYITLADIKQMVMEGDWPEVINVASGEDITREILLQIVLDHELNKEPVFSRFLLAQFILLQESKVSESFHTEFRQLIKKYTL